MIKNWIEGDFCPGRCKEKKGSASWMMRAFYYRSSVIISIFFQNKKVIWFVYLVIFIIALISYFLLGKYINKQVAWDPNNIAFEWSSMILFSYHFEYFHFNFLSSNYQNTMHKEQRGKSMIKKLDILRYIFQFIEDNGCGNEHSMFYNINSLR